MKTFAASVGTACWVLLAAGGLSGCKAHAPAAEQPAKSGEMNTVAEEYVKLVLAVGQHDADYVDAFYGPPEWKKAAESSKLDLNAIASKASELAGDLAREPEPP